MTSDLRLPTSDLHSPTSVLRPPTSVDQQPTTDDRQPPSNVAALMSQRARERPDQAAVLDPVGRSCTPIRYRATTFRELDELTDSLAADVLRRGVIPGMKLVLFV